jgi:hypothetical protein
LVITKTIHPSNYQYIRNFEDDAAGMWHALKEAHQDSSSGGRMYWLRKLIQSCMTRDNVKAHIEEMGGYAEKLNALITAKNPLTADDVHSTALLISLPSEWLHCVLALINEEQVSSSRIVSALKAESLRHQARGDESNPIVVASSTSAIPAAAEDKSKMFCTFCKRNGHTLLNCNNASKVLKEHKDQQQRDFQSNQGGGLTNKKPSTPKKTTSSGTVPPAAPPTACAGHASVVELNDFSGSGKSNNSDYSTYEVSRVAVVVPLASQILSRKESDFNLDSGCSVSMTPFLSSVDNVKLHKVGI